jgi:hypothetical protein
MLIAIAPAAAEGGERSVRAERKERERKRGREAAARNTLSPSP